jgi:hypothetical protein
MWCSLHGGEIAAGVIWCVHYKKIEELRHNDSGSLGTTVAAIFD